MKVLGLIVLVLLSACEDTHNLGVGKCFLGKTGGAKEVVKIVKVGEYSVKVEDTNGTEYITSPVPKDQQVDCFDLFDR